MTDVVQPADVLVRVRVLEGELELVRAEMGRPIDRRRPFTVAGAAPREVYFAALALFRKADRFAFERIGAQGVLPHPPAPGAIQPANVRNVVDAALGCVRAVKARMNISEAADDPGRDASTQPADVLAAVMRASRQINQLLDHPFVPDDVFQQVTLGLGYAAPLLARTSAAAPALPDFERRKRPADVYRRVWSAFSSVRGIYAALGLSCSELGSPPYEDDEIVPSDVYDLVALLTSELVYLHSTVPGVAPPSAAEFYEVERRLPAHVFQYVGHLVAYLEAIRAAAEADASAFHG